MHFGTSILLSSTLSLSTFTPVSTMESGKIKVERNLSIYEIESLREISPFQPAKTLYLFDLDDTIFDFPYMLGSSAWRKYIADATRKIDSSKNWHDIFSYMLAQKHPLTTVESITSEFVKELQEKGYPVCGFTSRKRNQWYATPQEGIDKLTTRQLNSVDINFNNKSLENIYPYLALDFEYFKGTFYANTESKGDYLLNLLKTAPQLPEKVIFIDDKSSQVESVAKALTELGIEHECYCYTATNGKRKTFNPLIANIQLYYFCKSNGSEIISDEEAALIAKENQEKGADDYLQAALDIAKDFSAIKSRL